MRSIRNTPVSDFERDLDEVLGDLRQMLVEKNLAYGDSALNPVRIFSNAPADEQINVRIDDKLSRIMRGDAAGEDAEWDTVGYLVLKRIFKNRKERGEL